MANSTHPLALDPGAIRLREHSLLEIEQVLGADAFSLDGEQVTFRRLANDGNSARTWRGRLGDWLVRDGAGFHRLVTDEVWTLASTGQRQKVNRRPTTGSDTGTPV